MKHPRGIYIVPDESFNGMEANSVVFIISQLDGSYVNETMSIRCNISRAVNQLSMVMEMKQDTMFTQSSNKILFHSTEVDSTLIACCKTMSFKAFSCSDNHVVSSLESKSSISELDLDENQQELGEKVSSPLSLLKTTNHICEACIHICHNNHQQRSHVKFGGAPSSSFLGAIKSFFGDVGRAIKCSVVGGTKCQCNEIVPCLISKI